MFALQLQQRQQMLCSRQRASKVATERHATRRNRMLLHAAAEQASQNGTGRPAPAAPKARPKKAAVDPRNTPFTNTNRFIVPQHLQASFNALWREREEAMQHSAGFQGLNITAKGDDEVVVSSSWASIPEWEAFSLGEVARRTHLPWGVMQYTPKPGEGFPEDFVPIKDYDAPVSAKY